MSKINVWNPLIEKFQKRLSNWKSKTLSFGGRRVLYQAVLGSIPTYFLSIFKAPKAVIAKLEKIRKDFFWGYEDTKNKISWVKWSSTLRSFDNGGLGIGSINAANLALLSKWVWKFRTEPTATWVKLIKAIHGPNGGIDTRQPDFKVEGQGPWQNVAAAVKNLINLGTSFDDFCSKKIGNGRNTCFWTERWTGEGILKDRFPRLFDLDRNSGATVADRVRVDGYAWEWRRELRGGRESSELDLLVENISYVDFGDEDDKWTWSLTTDGIFSVWSLRTEIEKLQLGIGPYKTRWNKLVPEK